MQDNAEKIAFKSAVRQACVDLLHQRIFHAEEAVLQAQENANEQEKSSVGDKHETARALSHVDRDMNARQLWEAKQALGFFETIPTHKICNVVALGALFSLEKQLFFVAVGLGSVHIKGLTVMVISHKSPLFEILKSKKEGDKVIFKGKEQSITNIY